MGGLVCCGIVPHLELARRPDLHSEAVVVGAFGGRVTAASEAALATGVTVGMTLHQAEATCPAAIVVEPDPAAAARLRELIAAALYDLAPVVDVRVDGHCWLGLGGVPGTGEAVREARRRLVSATGAEPRLGLAPGPFTAMVAAHHARPGRLVQIANAAAFLAPLPTSFLDLEPEHLERLDMLGLRTLGQVAAIGPRQLEGQLGRPGREAVLLARGDEPRLLTPWQPPGVTGRHRQFEPPVEDREALLFVARGLVDGLAVELGLRGAAAKRVRVLVEVDGALEPERKETLVRHPLSSGAELFGLVASWLREWTPAAGVGVVRLAVELPELEAAGRRQLRLWRGGDGSAEEVEAALERLQERHGQEVATRARPWLPASPLPEQRYELVPL